MPRRVLSAKTSWDDVYGYLAYVEIALSLAAEDGDKEIAPLVPPARKLITSWKSLDGDRQSRQTAMIRANALVGLRDVDLDEVTTSLHNDVLGEAKQKRKAPVFTRLFPKTLSQLVRMSLETQLGVSRTLLHKLAQPETPTGIRKAHEKPLKESIAAGEAAIKNREIMRGALQDLSTRIAGLRTEANSTLLAIEGSLKSIAGKRGLGMGFVNAFFPAPVAHIRRPTTPAPAPAAG